MILHHYSDQPVTLDRRRTYDQKEGRAGKPNGLWLSVVGEDDWESWCRSEEFSLGSLAVTHEVTLHPKAEILRLETPEQIDKFHATHSTDVDQWYQKALEDRSLSGEYVHSQRPIDWGLVAAKWSGIVFAPYQWSRRFSPFWYYAIDASSACIWDMWAVDQFSVAKDDRKEKA